MINPFQPPALGCYFILDCVLSNTDHFFFFLYNSVTEACGMVTAEVQMNEIPKYITEKKKNSSEIWHVQKSAYAP